MKNGISAAKSGLGKSLLPLMFIIPLVLAGCGGPKHMITMETKPVIAPKSGKALLVIARTTSIGAGITIENYLDKKMIGQTKGKSYFITDVAPGQHYVMSHSENWAAARISFEADRTYFLSQDIRMGFWIPRTDFTPMISTEAVKQLSDDGIEYRIYDAKNPGDDMSDKDFEEVKNDFEDEVKAGEHKDIVSYKGYSK